MEQRNEFTAVDFVVFGGEMKWDYEKTYSHQSLLKRASSGFYKLRLSKNQSHIEQLVLGPAPEILTLLAP